MPEESRDREPSVIREAKTHLTAVLHKEIKRGQEHPYGCGCPACKNLARAAEEWLRSPGQRLEDEVKETEESIRTFSHYGQTVPPEIHSVPDFDVVYGGELGRVLRRGILSFEEPLFQGKTLLELLKKKQRRLEAWAEEEDEKTGRPTRIIVIGQYETTDEERGRWAVVVGLTDNENKVCLPGGRKMDCSIKMAIGENDLLWVGLINRYTPGMKVKPDDIYFVAAADRRGRETRLDPSIDPLTIRKVVEGLDLFFKEQYSSDLK